MENFSNVQLTNLLKKVFLLFFVLFIFLIFYFFGKSNLISLLFTIFAFLIIFLVFFSKFYISQINYGLNLEFF